MKCNYMIIKYMKKIFFLFIIVLTVYLSGCTLGPDFQKPQYSTNNNFNWPSETTDTVINLRWWKIFNDPVLDTLIKIALAENRDVMIASARIQSAMANVGYTSADQWPSIDMQINANGGNFQGILQQNSSSSLSIYPSMNWEINFWGKYKRANEAARATLLASEYGKRTVQLEMISTVANTYFQLLDNKSKLEISKNTLQSRDSALRIIQDRFNFGIISEVDLNQAQIQRAISLAAIPFYERAIENNESSLNVLLGRYPQKIITGAPLFKQEIPPSIPVGLPSQLLTRRPDVQQAEALYAAQNARIGVAEAMRWPSFNLTGLLGFASNDLITLTGNGLAWAAGGSLLGPIFNFGKNKRRTEIEKYNTEAALRQYENVALKSFKEVENALVAIKTYTRELEANRIRNIAAINAEYLSQQRYDKGKTGYLEVLESQRQSFDAQRQYSETRKQLLIAYVALYKALGGGWLSPEEEQAAKTGK